MTQRFVFISLLVLCTSCEFFMPSPQQEAVARVGENYLYASDIKELITPSMTREDSARVVQKYISDWATKQLLMKKAKINLPEEKQNTYNSLVENYRTDLFTKEYKDIIATKTLDSTISPSEMERFYEATKPNFILNEELIKLRYLHIGNDNTSIDKIKAQFVRFDSIDKVELTQKEIQFKSHSLNDSVWVKVSTVLDAVPIITVENVDQLLKKDNFVELQDSLGVYLIYVNDVLFRNEEAPISYVKPTIEQIILNGRKLELIKKLEKDILEDAIKNKQFEEFPN